MIFRKHPQHGLCSGDLPTGTLRIFPSVSFRVQAAKNRNIIQPNSLFRHDTCVLEIGMQGLGKLINVRCASIWNSCTFLWTTNVFICSSSASFLAPNRPVLNLTGRVQSLILDKLSFVFPWDNKSAITIPWSVVKFLAWLNRWRSCAKRPPCSKPNVVGQTNHKEAADS